MNAAVAEETIDYAGRALIDAASVPANVILFGSRAGTPMIAVTSTSWR